MVNFVFLFAIAVLPYSVQTFPRFQMALVPFTLYLTVFLVVLHRPAANLQTDVRAFGLYVAPLIAVILIFVRRAIRQLPALLRAHAD